ncbi:MAG: asparagine synthetase B, partial [Alteromonadaceae bacterium]|nr:asparagine synthetase B [Alteromonadaceae bacterium]
RDYPVFEYPPQIPGAPILSAKEKKLILKKAFERMLPQHVLFIKKMGSSVPLAHWLCNELRPVVEQTVLSTNSGLVNFFEPAGIRKLWERHLAGDDQFTQELWSLLAFELWWQQYQVSA